MLKQKDKEMREAAGWGRRQHGDLKGAVMGRSVPEKGIDILLLKFVQQVVARREDLGTTALLVRKRQRGGAGRRKNRPMRQKIARPFWVRVANGGNRIVGGQKRTEESPTGGKKAKSMESGGNRAAKLNKKKVKTSKASEISKKKQLGWGEMQKESKYNINGKMNYQGREIYTLLRHERNQNGWSEGVGRKTDSPTKVTLGARQNI